jgi:hypothetical protein
LVVASLGKQQGEGRMTFDEWYAAQTGHKDRELAKAAWNASRAARDEAVSKRI